MPSIKDSSASKSYLSRPSRDPWAMQTTVAKREGCRLFPVPKSGVVSAGLVAVALILRDTLLMYESFLRYYTSLLVTMVIVVAACDFFAAAVGLVASIRRLRKVLLVYGVLVGVIFIVKISLFTASYLMKPDEVWSVDSCFQKEMETYEKSSTLMDSTQKKLRCCGENGPEDWFNVTGYIPASCCPDRNPTITEARCRIPEDFFLLSMRGCVPELEFLVPYNCLMAAAVLLIVQQIQQILSFGLSSYMSTKLTIKEVTAISRRKSPEVENPDYKHKSGDINEDTMEKN